jgi:ABC-type polysaccharide/polyol phosphate transport system ATPase subunit
LSALVNEITVGRGNGEGFAVSCREVSKTFRIPEDRPHTVKQRVLHPRRSRAGRDLDALQSVSFQVERGEFYGVIGRNGSGKSTLLKCLAGIYRPTSGIVRTHGRISPFIELGVGFNPELTALDNVVVNAALLGIPRKVARARFREIMNFAELERFEHLKLKNYSSGMYVRLGFAAAIQADAEVLLVDEVLAVGDARFQEKCFATFRSLKRSGKTVIYVTHDLTTVERFCDRALLLQAGQLVSEGDPRDVIQTYRQLNLKDEEAAVQPAEAPGQRFGDGSARVVEAWFETSEGARPQVFAQGATIVFKARIRFARPLDSPVFGVIVKNERGDHVVVTNTLFQELDTGGFDAGDEVIYSVAFPLLLADGLYRASPAVAHQDAQRFADWREEAVSIVVRGDRYSGGIVDLPLEADLERITVIAQTQERRQRPSTAAQP